MKLAELSAKPQLIKLSIDDEDIVSQYGEPIEFWVYDRQPMDTFMKLATLDKDNIAHLGDVIIKLILDENGKPMLADDKILPAGVMMKVITKVVDSLGNSVGQTTKK